MNAVDEIKNQIKELAEANGYKFEIYHTNHAKFAQDVGYAVIPAEMKRPVYYNNSRSPKQSAITYAVAYHQVVTSGEGTTEKCKAYKRLQSVLKELQDYLEKKENQNEISNS